MPRVEHHNKPRNVDQAFAEIDSLEVYEWHPLPEGRGQPTQVHVIIRLKDMAVPLVMSFKRPLTIDHFIAALQQHRESVWGKLTAEDLKRLAEAGQG